MLPMIVGEVSKNWDEGTPHDGDFLAKIFEKMIETNLLRGYKLHSFSLHRMMTRAHSMNETIIAVFQRLP
jgi:hypothetical protein